MKSSEEITSDSLNGCVLTVVIPMAGLSSRFARAGYDSPKYMLPVGSQTMFAWSVSSFASLFSKARFVFVCRDICGTPDFVSRYADSLGINNSHVTVLTRETSGQAETVYRGLEDCGLTGERGSGLLIFNIDSRIEDFRLPSFATTGSEPNDCGKCDGYLEVFKAEGDHWSFVEADPDDLMFRVRKTAEKQRISDLCSDGLYYFRDPELYCSTYRALSGNPDYMKNGEFYIAPMYNYLISQGMDIRYALTPRDNVKICGTPSEYTDYLAKNLQLVSDSR